MLDNYEHIANLITSFNKGNLTGKDHDELDEWITSNDKNKILFKELTDPEKFKEYLKQMDNYDQEEIFQKIKTYIGLPEIPKHRIFPFKKIAVAASIILAIGIGSYLLVFNKHKKDEIVKVNISHDVKAPEVNRAMITMDNGKTVYLDSLRNGTLATEEDIRLVKLADGQIAYQGSTKEVKYHTLTNPKGSKVIDMKFGDGSHVWLDAGSAITYPISFASNERRVSITGQGYFEVAHDNRRPFFVQKGEIEVQVLGTHFNVNAYDDEANIKVTLLEGSVKTSIANGESVTLKPGEQASVSSGIKVLKGIDIEEVMAWKNGSFYFNNTNIEVIMREAARWYDVEVTYEGNVKGEFFGGTVPRTENISQLIKALELTKTIKIDVEGKKLIIRPAK